MNNTPRKVELLDLGRIKYKDAWDYQETVFEKTVNQKIELRRANKPIPFPENRIILCEHPPVYTLGKNGKIDHLLVSESEMKAREIDFHRINRGGDITYHGPGQIVGYPILDLDQFFTDIHKYLRFLEEGIILTLKEYGINAGRIEGLTGVWLDTDNLEKSRKICAMGIKCSRWVTMHGFAFNVNTDLDYFTHIVPCGIDDRAVTSMEKELGQKQNIDEVKDRIIHHLGNLFDWELSIKSKAV
ncbi:MAG TPA: lipoyl(octanoyl) transferase LipB [Cryomorphaceae bacterium]|nr:lipoyl(octanoyl) transferase LipB [Cryomorphaceae bacterium]